MTKNIITNKTKIKAVESIFGESKMASSGTNVAVVCPSCKENSKNSSKKKKLSIEIDTGVYHCWVCESKGKFVGYFARKYFGNKTKEIVTLNEVFDIRPSDSIEEEPEEERIFLPDDFELISVARLSKTKVAREYLESRGLTKEDILTYKMGVSSTKYNRLIIPSFSEDMKLNYFVTRDYSNTSSIAYINCKIMRKFVIFNEYLIDWGQTVILVEGVFDAIKAGKNAIPVLGSWIDENHEVFRKIIKEKSDVILGFDPDARQKTLKVAKLLSEYAINVYVCDHKESDFGKMTKERCKYYIDNAKLYEQTDRMAYLIQSISGSI